MTAAAGSTGTAQGTDLGTGMDAWQQAVRDRCAQLRKDADAGRIAEQGLDEFDRVAKLLGIYSEELAKIADAAYVDATCDLNGYEHQSQGALVSADVKVREAALAAREAIEQRRRQALRDCVLAHIGELFSAGVHLPRLEDLAESGQRAAAELRDLERVRQSAIGDAPGQVVTYPLVDPQKAVEDLRAMTGPANAVYPAAGGKPGDVHRDKPPLVVPDFLSH